MTTAYCISQNMQLCKYHSTPAIWDVLTRLCSFVSALYTPRCSSGHLRGVISFPLAVHAKDMKMSHRPDGPRVFFSCFAMLSSY